MTSRQRLLAVLSAAIRSVDAGAAVARALPGRIGDGGDGGDEAAVVVLALGKAASAMAAPVAEALGNRVRAGLVVTKDGHAGDCGNLLAPVWRVRETAHPVPDARSEQAAREALALAAGSGDAALLLVLLSGGASSLTACPAAGLCLDDLAGTTRALLACGADIGEINCVRKHLSDLAGGQLARAAAAPRIEVLAVSDVAGDALDVIGSGPCAPDPTSFREALAVVDAYGIRDRVPAAAVAYLEAGRSGAVPETPKPDDPLFARVHHTIVAGNRDARAAAAEEARRQGLEPISLGECLAGEAREQARQLVARVRAEAGAERGPRREEGRRCFIAGGETTVDLRVAPGADAGAAGRGGRSQELALAAALALDPEDRIALLAAGTDGSDGPTDAAGAFVDPGTVSRGAARGVDARDALRRHDAYGFFAREGGLVVTGPTGTNVMDLVLIEA